jgi:hypothetical protein
VKHTEEFDGGMIAYCRRTGADKLPEAEELLSAAAKGIARSVQKRLSSATRKFLSERSNHATDTSLQAMIEETLFVGYRATPEEIMAQALDAQLNVTTAVVNDIRDEQRSELPRPVAKLLRELSEIKRQAKRDSRELTVDEQRRVEMIPDEISGIWQQIALASDNLDFAIENATPEESASTCRRYFEFIAKYPNEWAIIKTTKLDGLSNKELAKREKLSEARISQKLRDAMEIFHKFLDD